MLTPASRIKPWDLASRVGTVDRLSGGRVQLTVGLGALRAARAAEGLPWAGYDVVVEGVTVAGDAAGAERLRAFGSAGATWWIESDWSVSPDADGTAAIRAHRRRAARLS